MNKNQIQSMTDARSELVTEHAFKFNGVNLITRKLNNSVLLNLTLKNLKIH